MKYLIMFEGCAIKVIQVRGSEEAIAIDQYNCVA